MLLQNLVVVLLTGLCAYTDIRDGKIYNKATYTAALLGVAIHTFAPPSDPLQSLAGLLGALALYGMLRLFAGTMGAGDVKLMAAIGALKGLPFVLFASLYIFGFAAIAGVVVLARQGRLIATGRWIAMTFASFVVPGMERPVYPGEMTTVPFAPAIFLGTIYCVYLEWIAGPFTLSLR